MKTTLDVLKEARNLLANGWIQFRFAQTAEGVRASYKDHAASCFCAVGALRRSSSINARGYFDDSYFAACRAVGAAIGLPEDESIADWNDADGRTHDDVLAAFDRAIALASHSQTTEGK